MMAASDVVYVPAVIFQYFNDIPRLHVCIICIKRLKSKNFFKQNSAFPTTVMAKSEKGSQVGDYSYFANVMGMLPLISIIEPLRIDRPL